MKVKLFVDDGHYYLGRGMDDEINDFIADKDVVDIKFSNSISTTIEDGNDTFTVERSALVMYEEGENDRSGD